MAGSLLPPITLTPTTPAYTGPFGMSQSNTNAIGRLLQGFGAAASSYGAGSPQWGTAGAQAIDQAGQLQQLRQQQDLQNQIQQAQLQRQQQADADAQAQKAAAKSWLLGQAPTADRDRLSMSSGTPGAVASLPDALKSYYTGMADVAPVEAMQGVGEQLSKGPEKPVINGGMQLDLKTGTWSPIPGYVDEQKAIADAQRAPVQPPQLPADIQAWMLDRKNDPTNPAFKTIAGWRKSQQAGNGPVTYGDPITGDAAKALGFDSNGVYQKGSDGKYYVVPAAPKTSVTFKTVTGPDAQAINLDPSKTWNVGSDGTVKMVDKPATPTAPDLVTLTKDGQYRTIAKSDPQLGMYTGSGWLDANAVKAPSFITLVGPDDVVTLDKSDPKVKQLTGQGYIERSGSDPNSKPFTEDQSKTAQLLTELLPDRETGYTGDYTVAMQNFDELSKLRNQAAAAGGDLTKWAATPQYQRAVAALGHIISNNLYSKSGAQITDPEAKRLADLLIPKPFESDASIADKRQRIAGLLAGMKARAGKAGANLNIPSITAASDVPDGLPPGSVPFGRSKTTGNPVWKLPNGSTMEQQD